MVSVEKQTLVTQELAFKLGRYGAMFSVSMKKMYRVSLARDTQFRTNIWNQP